MNLAETGFKLTTKDRNLNHAAQKSNLVADSGNTQEKQVFTLTATSAACDGANHVPPDVDVMLSGL